MAHIKIRPANEPNKHIVEDFNLVDNIVAFVNHNTLPVIDKIVGISHRIVIVIQ